MLNKKISKFKQAVFRAISAVKINFEYDLLKKTKNSGEGFKIPNFTKLLFGVFFLGLFSMPFFISGCASMKQPEGGPRDTIAPRILKETPKNYSVNFKEKKIIIQFDEFFKLQNQAKEFSISPELSKNPILKVNKKVLEIEFQDTLEKNTTYTLNFGESIQDVNESNKVQNYTYVFATGPKLDSLSISGNVKDALALKHIDKQVLVFLVPIDRDTILGKKRPSIYTYADSSGSFALKNLREDKYHLYALSDESGDKVYQQSVDKIGFLTGVIDLHKDTSGIELKLFAEPPAKLIAKSKQINNDGSIGLIFNKGLKNLNVSVVDPVDLDKNKQIIYSAKKDSVKIWLHHMDFDSVRLNVMDTDSLLQSIKLTRSAKQKYKREVLISDNVSSGSLSLGRNYAVSTNFPIDKIQTDSIVFLEDSVRKTNFSLVRDKTNFLKFEIQYPYRAKKNYNITFDSGAVLSTYGSKNLKYNVVFKQASTDDFGTLTVKYKIADSIVKKPSYVVELLKIDNYEMVTKSVIHSDTTILYKNFPAQKYYLRVIEDKNNNGEWDTGDVFRRLQPEKVWIAAKQMYLRANWETEETVEIPSFAQNISKTDTTTSVQQNINKKSAISDAPPGPVANQNKKTQTDTSNKAKK